MTTPRQQRQKLQAAQRKRDLKKRAGYKPPSKGQATKMPNRSRATTGVKPPQTKPRANTNSKAAAPKPSGASRLVNRAAGPSKPPASTPKPPTNATVKGAAKGVGRAVRALAGPSAALQAIHSIGAPMMRSRGQAGNAKMSRLGGDAPVYGQPTKRSGGTGGRGVAPGSTRTQTRLGARNPNDPRFKPAATTKAPSQSAPAPSRPSASKAAPKPPSKATPSKPASTSKPASSSGSKAGLKNQDPNYKGKWTSDSLSSIKAMIERSKARQAEAKAKKDKEKKKKKKKQQTQSAAVRAGWDGNKNY